jgi:hypothetical protein
MHEPAAFLRGDDPPYPAVVSRGDAPRYPAVVSRGDDPPYPPMSVRPGLMPVVNSAATASRRRTTRTKRVVTAPARACQARVRAHSCRPEGAFGPLDGGPARTGQ